MTAFDLDADPVELTAALVDIASVSGQESELADAVEHALRTQASTLQLMRSGNTVLARTRRGLARRVVLAGHLDTVPINGNHPHRRSGGQDGEELMLHGCGSVDMKGGDAVMLHLAAAASASRNSNYDLTFVFYDCEEVEAARNGLGRIERELPEWLSGDLAIVGEASNGVIEAGCQGTIRVQLRAEGIRAHTARAWMGENAVHAMAPALRLLEEYRPRDVEIDGCRYREGLQAVAITGGVAGNVVPDECVLTVNHRFAPDRTLAQAQEYVTDLFADFDATVVDASAGALPRLSDPVAKDLVAASGGDPVAKLGWTDVARFAALGMPAVNFGPGDPMLAHTKEEHVPASAITHCASVLRGFLGVS